MKQSKVVSLNPQGFNARLVAWKDWTTSNINLPLQELRGWSSWNGTERGAARV